MRIGLDKIYNDIRLGGSLGSGRQRFEGSLGRWGWWTFIGPGSPQRTVNPPPGPSKNRLF